MSSAGAKRTDRHLYRHSQGVGNCIYILFIAVSGKYDAREAKPGREGDGGLVVGEDRPLCTSTTRLAALDVGCVFGWDGLGRDSNVWLVSLSVAKNDGLT